LAGLLGVSTSDHLGAIVNSLLRVESTLFTGETLENHLRRGVDLEVLDGGGVVAGDLGCAETADTLHGGRKWV